MKRFHLLLGILTMTIASCYSKPYYEPKVLDPDVSYDNVYLIMGQSNASGVSQHSYLEQSHPDIYQQYKEGNPSMLISYDTDDRIEQTFVPTQFGFGHNNTYFGPEIGIADVLSNKETQYIIKATYSGSCLMTQYVDWNGKKLELYKRYIKFIKNQMNALQSLGKNPRLRGIFWMQGESDAVMNKPHKYKDAMQWFYEYLRSDLNNWIYGQLNFVDAYIFTHGAWTHADVVNCGKQEFADANPHCFCIKTNGEDEGAITLHVKSETGEEEDIAHYDSSSMLLLGQTAGSLLIKDR